MIICYFPQTLGGTIGLGIAEPVFASQLSKKLAMYAPTAPEFIVKQSPTAIYSTLPPDLVHAVVRVYTESLKLVFLTCVPVGELSVLSFQKSVGMRSNRC